MIIIEKRKIKYIALFVLLLISIVLIFEYSGKLLYPRKYKEYVEMYSQENNIDPYLVYAIIKAESNFKPDATSHKNARGLMQITEKTGRWGAERMGIENFTLQNLYDPKINISIGCWYLGVLMEEFNDNTDLVIAAYNGGSGKVSQWLKNREYSSSGTTLDKIPFKETENYLKRVKNNYSVYKELYE